MVTKRLIAATLTCVLLSGGCALLRDDEQVSGACARALDRVAQVGELRAQALDRTAAVTAMDPVRVTAVVDHREEAQRAVFGPIARISARADQRARGYRRLRDECRRDSSDLSPRCEEAFTRARRLAGDTTEARQTRVDYWSEQLRMAQSALDGEVDTAQTAAARWDRLLTEYEHQVDRIDRAAAQQDRAAADCRETL